MPIRVVVDNLPVEVKHIKFSDGGSNIKIELPEKINGFISVTIDNEPVDSYPYLIMVINNIIDEHILDHTVNTNDIILNLPYFPHARADRKFEEGMVIPRDIIKWVIDQSWFRKVITYDLHSEISFEDCQLVEIKQCDLFLDKMQCIKKWYKNSIFNEEFILVAPDKGAKKKIFNLAEKLIDYPNFEKVILCDKTRDPSTGWITGITVEDDVDGKNIIIVDDICDGGATFIKLGEELKNRGANKIALYVTHGIFSKGLDPFKGIIDEIYCHQVIGEYTSKTDLDYFNNGW